MTDLFLNSFQTATPLRKDVSKSDNSTICSPATVISMATGGGLVMILLIALIIVLVMFKREIRQYRRYGGSYKVFVKGNIGWPTISI